MKEWHPQSSDNVLERFQLEIPLDTIPEWQGECNYCSNTDITKALLVSTIKSADGQIKVYDVPGYKCSGGCSCGGEWFDSGALAASYDVGSAYFASIGNEELSEHLAGLSEGQVTL